MYEQSQRKDQPVSKHSAIINGFMIFALKNFLVRTRLKDSIRSGLRFYHIHYSALHDGYLRDSTVQAFLDNWNLLCEVSG